jgi:DNA-binding LytR/AlgR family response regulator
MVYIESQNSKCILHCKENLVYTAYKKLSDIEEELSNPVFLRCHRSYLINMDEVISADRSRFVMTSGEQIPIRRQDAKEILETYRLYSNTSE